MKILSFGEILWDVYPHKKYIGGAPFNFAAHLANHGEKVYMLTSVGKDDLGNDAILRLKEQSVEDEYVAVTQFPTGRCDVSITDGIPKYRLLENVAFDNIPCPKLNHKFHVLYFGTLALRSQNNIETLKKLLANNSFSEIFVDINIRPPFYTKEIIDFSISKATILKISSEELPIVSEAINLDFSNGLEEFLSCLAQKYSNLKIIIITLGDKGAFAFSITENKFYNCPAAKTTVLSTVGAGDGFSAAFLHKHLNDCNIKDSLEYATKVAGFVVSSYEAVPKYSIAELSSTIADFQ